MAMLGNSHRRLVVVKNGFAVKRQNAFVFQFAFNRPQIVVSAEREKTSSAVTLLNKPYCALRLPSGLIYART